MDEDLKTEYRGFIISYVEGAEDWLIHDDGIRGERRKKSLSECKEWVDNTFNSIKRQAGLYLRYYRYEKVTVTSFAETEYGHAYYWITFADGSRRKAYDVKVYDEKNPC